MCNMNCIATCCALLGAKLRLPPYLYPTNSAHTNSLIIFTLYPHFHALAHSRSDWMLTLLSTHAPLIIYVPTAQSQVAPNCNEASN